jgi:indolepyruvate ferredoxin oxidoreductase
MGLDEEELSALGVRVLKLSLIYPLDKELVRDFARGLEEVIVVEEKRGLVEEQVKAALYGLDAAPRVVGKSDEHGRPLFPSFGELDTDAVAERLGPRLLRLAPDHPGIRRRLQQLRQVRSRPVPSVPARLPNYCSGCPHSRSTSTPGEGVVGGGIGCHGMGLLMSQQERQVSWLVPMGAEGAPWLGIAPFVDRGHLFQNVGDGTFFHSASQSLRNAVAAGANITFKLLYNGHVSMTGGQPITGGKGIPALTQLLEAEGVARTIVVSEQPRRYRRARLARNAKVYSRDRYWEALQELKRTPGVTVLIYDQECAAEKRRARKRGVLPEPAKRVFINEDVCEGCGDCGYKSNCMSVRPVETEFGRKTQIHQPSCNTDYSCLEGDCPAFLTVYVPPRRESKTSRLPPHIDPSVLPEPRRRVLKGPYRIYMPGVGGTGVVTTNQVLAYAALMEGKEVLALDQTGLAQKGGAVLSSLTIAPGPLGYLSNRVGAGQADLVLALDALGAAQRVNLDRCWPGRTVVVGNLDREPVAEEVRHVEFEAPKTDTLRSIVDAYSSAKGNVWVRAGRVAERLFGDQTKVNTFLVGVAYRAGLIPLDYESIEAAYRLNGVDVEENICAFRYGRLYYHEPALVERLLGAEKRGVKEEAARSFEELGRGSPRGRAYLELLGQCGHLDDESQRLLAVRIRELILYQDVGYAERYVRRVLEVARREEEVVPGRRELTGAVIRNLHKVMAYKDEYEVARLLLRDEWKRRVEEEFGAGARVCFNLHPPILRALGLKRKIEVGAWIRPLLRLLVALRRLRGSPFDPFGRTRVRREERALIEWYDGLVQQIVEGLTAHNYQVAVELASLPERIRGYEEIKLARMAEAKAAGAVKLREFVQLAEGDPTHRPPSREA